MCTSYGTYFEYNKQKREICIPAQPPFKNNSSALNETTLANVIHSVSHILFWLYDSYFVD